MQITNEKTALLQTLLKKYDEVGEFIGGIAIVMRDGLYGLVDDQGKEIYAPKCSNIWRWPNNFFKFEIDGKRGVLNSEGVVVIMPIYKEIWEFKNNRALVLIEYQGINWHLMEVSQTGDIVVADYWKRIS